MISRKIRRSLDQTEARFIRTLSRDLDEEEEGDDSDDAAGLSWLASANAKQGKHVFGVQSLPAAHVKMVSAVYALPPPLLFKTPTTFTVVQCTPEGGRHVSCF